jgi:hypothetical protein
MAAVAMIDAIKPPAWPFGAIPFGEARVRLCSAGRQAVHRGPDDQPADALARPSLEGMVTVEAIVKKIVSVFRYLHTRDST